MISVLKIKFPFPIFMGIVLGFLLYSNSCLAEPSRYHLDIRFLPEQQTLLGKATINIPSGKEWHLYTGGMEIQEIILKEEGKASFTMPLPRKIPSACMQATATCKSPYAIR